MLSIYNKEFRSVYKLTAHIVLVTKSRKKAISPKGIIEAKRNLYRNLEQMEI